MRSLGCTLTCDPLLTCYRWLHSIELSGVFAVHLNFLDTQVFCFELSNESLPHKLQHLTLVFTAGHFRKWLWSTTTFSKKEKKKKGKAQGCPQSRLLVMYRKPSVSTQCMQGVCPHDSFFFFLMQDVLEISCLSCCDRSTNEQWRYSSVDRDKLNFHN